MLAESHFPENFHLLHRGEETIRLRSIERIEASADLMLHAKVIEPAITLIRHYILRDEHKNQDDLHIRWLGVRLTNSLTAALQGLLSGYYQPSTLLQRDLIETGFLLNYLSLDLSRIKEWREADEKTLKDKFKPVTVRMALDEHYNHTEKKRATTYNLFSQLAGHPTPQGFAMIRRPDGMHECGPFFDETALVATLSEMAKHAISGTENFEKFFSRATRVDYESQFAFYVPKLRWLERYFNQPVDEKALSTMRQEISKIPW